MITSDFGFVVENYVGTYHMVRINDDTVIVSDEYHPAHPSEKELIKKKLFMDDFRTNDYMVLDFSNIDILNDDEILRFCNKYGLPISSCILDDNQSGYEVLGGIPVSEQEYAKVNPYYRQDTMNREEFRHHVCTAKRIMQIKYEIEHKENPINLFKYLLPLLLYDQISLFDFDIDEPEQHYPSMIFQQYFLKIKHKYADCTSFAADLFYFMFELQQIRKGANKVPITSKIERTLGISFTNDIFRLLVEVLHMGSVNDIVYDKYYNLSVPENTVLPEELISSMYKIAPQVLADSINEFMYRIHPELTVDSRSSTFGIDWQLDNLYEGLCVEIMLMISSNNLVKKCQNPTCEKFFTPNNGHSDKLYCSHECGVCVAKRRQRQRDKQDPTRKRLQSGFQSRKKNSN